MKKFFGLTFLLFTVYLRAQEWQIAVINDPDGFSFVRSGAGKNFPVVDSIRKNYFFFCTGDTNVSWIPVQNPIGKSGYMHRSRVAFFSRLDSLEQHQLIINAF